MGDGIYRQRLNLFLCIRGEIVDEAVAHGAEPPFRVGALELVEFQFANELKV